MEINNNNKEINSFSTKDCSVNDISNIYNIDDFLGKLKLNTHLSYRI